MRDTFSLSLTTYVPPNEKEKRTDEEVKPDLSVVVHNIEGIKQKKDHTVIQTVSGEVFLVIESRQNILDRCRARNVLAQI